jgi:hypothetical protein
VNEAYQQHGISYRSFQEGDCNYAFIYKELNGFVKTKVQDGPKFVLVDDKKKAYGCLDFLENLLGQRSDFLFYEFEDLYHILNMNQESATYQAQRQLTTRTGSQAVSKSTFESESVLLLEPVDKYYHKEKRSTAKRKCPTHKKLDADYFCPLADARLLNEMARKLARDANLVS